MVFTEIIITNFCDELRKVSLMSFNKIQTMKELANFESLGLYQFEFEIKTAWGLICDLWV